MRVWKATIAASVAIVAGLAVATPATAQEDLDCGDPGTSHNMPVDPNNDPHDLDADNDGVGCEDPTAFDGAGAPAPAAPATTDRTTMPRTGTYTAPLAIGAVVLIGGGTALVLWARRRSPRIGDLH